MRMKYRYYPRRSGQLLSLKTLDLDSNELKSISGEIEYLSCPQTLNVSNPMVFHLYWERSVNSMNRKHRTSNPIQITFDRDLSVIISSTFESRRQSALLSSKREVGQLLILRYLNFSNNLLTSLPVTIGQLKP